MKNILKKGAYFTDIHFGKHSNSSTHNQDCLNFIDWFIQNVKKDNTIDHICFLGDWNENRSSLNISTLNYSYQGAKKLNELNIPVYFIIGNHDLYQRHTREIHSVIPFTEFSNFILINEITYIDYIGGGTLFCPFLFHDEYKELQKHREVKTWIGHFEFKGFQITGYGVKMPTGPDPMDFTGPKRIFSGHFHKRQLENNICYIGNTFPMDFSDTNDNERGMAIYNYESDIIQFKNWEECPKYLKINLSSLVEENLLLDEKTRLKCIIDIPIDYEEILLIKQKFQNELNIREFLIEDSSTLNESITETQSNVDTDELLTIDEMVVNMLNEISTKQIDNDLLIKIYKELNI